MKKLLTLAVAGCMVLGSLGTASAVDVKVNGQWWFQYGYYDNTPLTRNEDSGKHSDRIRARQRIRTQIQFIADENLKAMLNFEHSSHWGSTGSNYGALDADKGQFYVKHAYLDWTIPNTQTQIRMGMQGLRLPSVAFGNPVFDNDVAGVAVSTQITPELGLTAFWYRPYDAGYYENDDTGDTLHDDMDLFGVMLPIKTDIVRATPWGMFALIGKDSDYWTDGNGTYTNPMSAGTVGATNGSGRGRHIDKDKVDSTIWGWWAGTTFELPVLDPFFVKIDAMMGGLETGDSDYDTFGYLVAADIGYKFSFGALSAIGWYASGDDDEDDRGIMPVISDAGGFKPTRYGTAGTNARSWDRILTGTGLGMWGIGAKLANVSFVENLQHSVIAMYMGGTNKGDAAARRSVHDPAFTDSNFGNAYLMSSDRAWEINLLNEYKVNQNLKFNFDLAYVWLDLGDHWDDKDDTEGSFAAMLGVTYSF
ncbi:MAG: hypothetical protein DELT_03021 [Desulfovibrio sp.]